MAGRLRFDGIQATALTGSRRNPLPLLTEPRKSVEA
jgi:hypothetical protein